jgi:hypothetical protein
MTTKAQLGITPEFLRFTDAVAYLTWSLSGHPPYPASAAPGLAGEAVALLPAFRHWMIANEWAMTEAQQLRDILDVHPELGYWDTTPMSADVLQAIRIFELSRDDAVRLLGGSP